MRANTFLGAAAVLLALAGCTPDITSTPPTTTRPTRTTTITVTPSATPTTSVTPAGGGTAAAVARPTLGPDGFGALKFGMTKEQALATKLVAANSSGFYLVAYPVPENTSPVCVTPAKGVAAIFAVGDMRTPEGIGLGSTYEQVKGAYPALRKNVNDHSAPVTGNPAAYYTIGIADGKVRELGVAVAGHDCFG